MTKKESLARGAQCTFFAVALAATGCAASARFRKAPPAPVSPEAAAIQKATDAFALGREAALSGDFQCAQDYFGQALEAVRPAGSPPTQNAELAAFSLELYEGILRYEALAAPAEDAAASEDHIAPELKQIEAPVATEEAISNARKAVASDTAGVTYDIPIIVNDTVLRIIATFQNDLHEVIARGLARSGRYVPMIHRIFFEEGIPRDLAQVALIESSFLPHARSPKRAHGIWQFMPRTGRRYGLTSNAVIDERSDPEKATRAAARYLSYLHELFHDWYLAMAAYNAGEGKILRAIEKTGFNDFWQLATTGHLRRQTQSYVPAVIAATLISKNPAHYGFDVEYEKPLEYETVTLDRPIHLRHLTDGDAVTLEDLERLNPELRTDVTPRQPEGYELKVPAGTKEGVLLAFSGAPTARPAVLHRHVVKRGETLASIAKRFGVSLKSLGAANSLPEGARLKRGRVILIPEREGRVASGKSKKARSKGKLVAAPGERSGALEASYRVKGGDTLYRIAMRHGTTVESLMAANSLPAAGTIRPGDRLRIPTKSR